MKKLTLDETWRLCLSMWRWIAKQKREGSRKRTDVLKREWLRLHKIPTDAQPNNACYFCEYNNEHNRGGNQDTDTGCTCPGNRIDKKFDCCHSEYHFYKHPIAFYNKLVSLNRKRLAKKRG